MKAFYSLFLLIFGFFQPVFAQDDSVRVSVQSGYYFMRIPCADSEEICEFQNEMEWIYVDEKQCVFIFITANYEYCMSSINFKKRPKQIYRKIKKENEKFLQLFQECQASGTSYVTNIDSTGKMNRDGFLWDVHFSKPSIFKRKQLTLKIDFAKTGSIQNNYLFIGK